MQIVRTDNLVEWYPQDAMVHIAIVGQTGSGKSWLAKSMAQSLAQSSNCRVLLIDTAGVDTEYDLQYFELPDELGIGARQVTTVNIRPITLVDLAQAEGGRTAAAQSRLIDLFSFETSGVVILDDCFAFARYKQDELLKLLAPNQQRIGLVLVAQTIRDLRLVSWGVEWWVVGQTNPGETRELEEYVDLHGVDLAKIKDYNFVVFPSRVRK